MKVRYYYDVEIPAEVLSEMSESMDLTLYGNRLVARLIKDADSCDDLPLNWKEITSVPT